MHFFVQTNIKNVNNIIRFPYIFNEKLLKKLKKSVEYHFL